MRPDAYLLVDDNGIILGLRINCQIYIPNIGKALIERKFQVMLRFSYLVSFDAIRFIYHLKNLIAGEK